MTCREYATSQGILYLMDVKGLDEEVDEEFIKFIKLLKEANLTNGNN